MTTDEITEPSQPLKLRRDGLRVYETHRQIVEAIMRGDFVPGERLRDSLLAEQLGLSRAPVREALRLLHQEGLVSKEPNRSYRVAEFTDSDLMELAVVRISLEATAIRALAHLHRDLEPIEATMEQLRHAGDGGDQSTVVRADLAFHSALVEATGLTRLIATYSPTRNQTMIALLTAIATERWPGTRASYDEHRALLTSIREAQRTNDPAPALSLLESHILGGRAARIIGSPP